MVNKNGWIHNYIYASNLSLKKDLNGKKPGVCGWVVKTYSPLTNCLGSILDVGYVETLNLPGQLSHPLRWLQISGGLVYHLSSEGIPWSGIKKQNSFK